MSQFPGQGIPPTGQVPPQMPAGTGPPPVGPKRPVVLWIVLGVIAALLLCGCMGLGALALFSTNSDTTGSGSGEEIWDDSGDTSGQGGDAAVKQGVHAIAEACSAFAGQYGYGPATDDVGPDGAVASFMNSWPTNPFTGAPMQQSQSPGDFRFETATSMGSGREYAGYVTGYLSDGSSYPVEFTY